MNAGGGKGPNHTERGHVTSSSSPTLLPSAKLTKHTRISYLTFTGMSFGRHPQFQKLPQQTRKKGAMSKRETTCSTATLSLSVSIPNFLHG